MYDLFIDPPAPLVPAPLRREVRERLLADGSVLTPLDEDGARDVVRALTQDGVEAVAISLLHAFVNPAHERRLVAIVREVAPALPVSCSSDVVPEIREYERTSTTVANAYPSGGLGTPIEVIENISPLLVERKTLRRDSGGAGELDT